MNSTLKALAAAMMVAGLSTGPALGGDDAPLPQEQTRGAVTYVTGGIGADEADAFRRAATQYPLELQFARKAQPKDEFLSNVKVTIRDRDGNVVLDTQNGGPFLLAKLPAGRYTIEARHYGVVKRQAVDIRAGKHLRNVFVWEKREPLQELTMA